MSEKKIMHSQMIALSEAGTTIWRQNVGQAWAGNAQRITRQQMVAVGPGDVVIRAARPFQAGLCKGSSDLIGITPITIEQHHMGSQLGIFTAVESKTARGRPTEEQLRFIDHVNGNGGFAGIARSDDDAIEIISRHRT